MRHRIVLAANAALLTASLVVPASMVASGLWVRHDTASLIEGTPARHATGEAR